GVARRSSSVHVHGGIGRWMGPYSRPGTQVRQTGTLPRPSAGHLPETGSLCPTAILLSLASPPTETVTAASSYSLPVRLFMSLRGSTAPDTARGLRPVASAWHCRLLRLFRNAHGPRPSAHGTRRRVVDPRKRNDPRRRRRGRSRRRPRRCDRLERRPGCGRRPRRAARGL